MNHTRVKTIYSVEETERSLSVATVGIAPTYQFSNNFPPIVAIRADCKHGNIKNECEFPYGYRRICQDCGKDFTI